MLFSFLFDKFDPPGAQGIIDAFDQACSEVLSQLADDIRLHAQALPVSSARTASTEDLRQLVRLCLEEAQSSSDQERKACLAEHAFCIAQLAEKLDRDAKSKVD